MRNVILIIGIIACQQELGKAFKSFTLQLVDATWACPISAKFSSITCTINYNRTRYRMTTYAYITLLLTFTIKFKLYFLMVFPSKKKCQSALHHPVLTLCHLLIP